MTTFKDIVNDKALMLAIDDLGFSTPTEIQEKTIPPALDGKDVIGQALWSPAEIRDLKAAVAYARTVMNKAPVRGQQQDWQSTAMALASRSTAFIARALYQAVAVGKAEELFFTPQGIASLRTLATTSDPTKAAYQAALGYIAGLSSTGERRDEQPTEETAVYP